MTPRTEFKKLLQGRAALGALLVIAVMFLYAPLLHHQFIRGFDDDVYITENTHVTSGFTVQNLKWAFTSTEPFYWHPLTWLSHTVDCKLFGLNSGAHHYENALWHALNALLLFLLLDRATMARWRSFAVAALFAVHPLNVQTVAWAAERKALLSMFFCLLTVGAYGWYVRQPGPRRYLVVSVMFGLALASKPSAITMPAVLLLVDYWPLRRHEEMRWTRRWGWLALEKLPLLMLGAATSIATIGSEKSGGFLMTFKDLPLLTRIETAILSYVAYVSKTIWPTGLTVFHVHPSLVYGKHLPIPEVLASATILLAITAGVFWTGRQRRYLAMGWLLFLGTMAPVIGFIQTGLYGIQEHLTYVPCIGLFIALSWGMAEVSRKIGWPRSFALVLLFCGLAGYVMATARHIKTWQDGVTLFARAHEVTTPPNSWVEMLYANELRFAGRNDEALGYYRESCELGPGNAFCHFEIAQILFNRGQMQQALEEYQTTLDFTDRISSKDKKELDVKSLNRSADILLRLGFPDAAAQQVNRALRIDSDNADSKKLRSAVPNRVRADTLDAQRSESQGSSR